MTTGENPDPMDLLTEDLLTFAQAAQEIPTRPSTGQIYRWADRGVSGIKLQSVWVGNSRRTSRQAITRFLQQTQRPSVS
ncbi:DUF1580 domain-containing protein [Crateriforma conspicua]|uniref:Uncharacterized protein n=1 Tax=Crateriforma conspicua TaxID=2527996 RepID=A0A5C6FML9_9PLAN|nr:hypothetical protein V7x_42690 [Crateriforma conspicua]